MYNDVFGNIYEQVIEFIFSILLLGINRKEKKFRRIK